MNDELEKFKFGLIAVCQSNDDKLKGQIEILHFCGYEYPPTENDKKSLENELNIDPEFSLVGRINKDVFIINATPEMVDFYIKNVDDWKQNGGVGSKWIAKYGVSKALTFTSASLVTATNLDEYSLVPAFTGVYADSDGSYPKTFGWA
jgi:hypothetical protein